MQYRLKKQINRGRIRRWVGLRLYAVLRFCQWHDPRVKYARVREAKWPAHEAFVHATPLLRRLAGADMWMQHNKVVNLRIAAGRLNAVTIMPGERFSYWRLIGEPNKKKGFLPGMVLRDGRIIAGIGGGLCQMSNMIYWMALHTPLTVTERHRHTFDVFPDAGRDQPFGTGATCAYPGLDLQIENRTGTAYQLRVEVGETHLYGAFFTDEPQRESYEVYQSAHEITPGAFGGYVRHNAVRRRVFTGGKLIGDEPVTENHAYMMYPPMIGA